MLNVDAHVVADISGERFNSRMEGVLKEFMECHNDRFRRGCGHACKTLVDGLYAQQLRMNVDCQHQLLEFANLSQAADGRLETQVMLRDGDVLRIAGCCNSVRHKCTMDGIEYVGDFHAWNASRFSFNSGGHGSVKIGHDRLQLVHAFPVAVQKKEEIRHSKDRAAGPGVAGHREAARRRSTLVEIQKGKGGAFVPHG
ncbi:MAG: hypothetical protein FWD68_09455 [Alphaproteobacteria bacterium]|nr:hypothetical protein [Alphaproteobacteria bacterium]